MKRICLLLLPWLALSLFASADELTFERVIGTEFPGKYKHPASIEELAGGDLYIAYYGGDGEYAEVTAVYGMRKAKGESQWSQPAIIADTHVAWASYSLRAAGLLGICRACISVSWPFQMWPASILAATAFVPVNPSS